MTINKKFLQLTGAFLILVFHLWIRLSSTMIESFFVHTAYIGVDLFFLVSIVSLASKEISYKEFIHNRIMTIYLPFVFFVLMNAFVQGKYTNIIRQIFFIEFFQKGGGAFLWFLPAMLLLYLVFPFFHQWKNPYKTCIAFGMYILTVWICTVIKYDQIMILLHRIPLMLVTYELCKKEIPNQKTVGICLFLVGILILYFCTFVNHFYLKDMFYIYAIPCVIGSAMMIPVFPLAKGWNAIANATLEIYAIQMIFGFRIAGFVYKSINHPFLSTVITFSIIISIAVGCSEIKKKLLTVVQK